MHTIVLLLLLADPNPFDFRSEPAYGARVDTRTQEIAALREKCTQLETSNTRLNNENDILKRSVATLEGQPLLQLSGLASLQEELPTVQIRITTSDGCGACHVLVAQLVAYLRTAKGWGDVQDKTSQFYVNNISDAEWQAQQLTLPLVELLVRDRKTTLLERDPASLVRIYNAAMQADNVNAPKKEQLAGMTLGSVPGKVQAEQFLAMLEPFIDGGTLQVTYTAKPGVIKNFLTMKRGSYGIKLPSKTTFTFAMNKGDLAIQFIDPKPELLFSGFDRRVNEIDITPNKISVRLPYMIDPELSWKD